MSFMITDVFSFYSSKFVFSFLENSNLYPREKRALLNYSRSRSWYACSRYIISKLYITIDHQSCWLNVINAKSRKLNIPFSVSLSFTFCMLFIRTTSSLPLYFSHRHTSENEAFGLLTIYAVSVWSQCLNVSNVHIKNTELHKFLQRVVNFENLTLGLVVKVILNIAAY